MKQVVILCGGQGKRLRPLTKNLPKPMVKINGKPFLWHLINQFKNYGVKNFLLLTGYKSKIIREYFADGSELGLNIDYDNGPVEWKTNKRLYNARKKIRKNFILMYSDNFVNYPFEKMRQFHIKEKKPLTLFLSKKNKGNIKLGKDLKILKYDKLRGKSNFNYVEIGYMFASKKKLFSYISDRNIDFSDSFKDIIKDNNLNALISCEKYYSISDQARLKKTKKFFSKKKIILLDRDGIINKKKSKGNYVTKWSEFKLIKDNIDGLTKLSKSKFKFIIITNQAGVGRKKMSIKKLNFIHENLKKIFKSKGINILKIYSCPHHWIDECDCRKPKTGLFYKASSEYNFELNQVIYIGDDPRDCLAAFNSGCKSLLINNKKTFKEINKLNKPLAIKNNIVEAINMINNFYNKSYDYY